MPPAPHNVLRSRLILDHNKDITKLDWAYGAEKLKFHAQNDPDKIYTLVVEYEPNSGEFELCTEWRYAEKFGGDVLQARTIGDVLRQDKAARERAEAQNEADAIGGP